VINDAKLPNYYILYLTLFIKLFFVKYVDARIVRMLLYSAGNGPLLMHRWFTV